MTKPKTLDQLRAEKERAETQLAQEQHKLERLENRKKYLEKGERTKRTHRLCNLGGTIESLAPEVKDLTRTEMTELVEYILREFYPWYMEDVMVEVTEEVAEELLAGQRYIKASRRRIYRNKAHYSLDAEDGIEYSACFSNPSPQELIERMERFEYLCHALNSLPDAQGQRVFEHYLLGHSVKAIAAAEGVTERAVSAAIQRGLENMKKYLKNVL